MSRCHVLLAIALSVGLLACDAPSAEPCMSSDVTGAARYAGSLVIADRLRVRLGVSLFDQMSYSELSPLNDSDPNPLNALSWTDAMSFYAHTLTANCDFNERLQNLTLCNHYTDERAPSEDVRTAWRVIAEYDLPDEELDAFVSLTQVPEVYRPFRGTLNAMLLTILLSPYFLLD